MEEIKKKSTEPRNYKERFEFVLTTGGNIICQRYFRINNFNPKSLQSYDLTSAIRNCVSTIDRDLKEKTQVYLELYAPQVFDSVEEMNAFFSKAENRRRVRHGHGIVIRGNSETDYVWMGTEARPLGSKFDNGELTDGENNKTTYKFAFKVDGREVCSMIWEGSYPKFVRDKIDISNKWAKFNSEEVDRLSMEQYLLYKMGEGRTDLVYGIIKSICIACSYPEDEAYTTTDYTKVVTVADSTGMFKDRLRIIDPKHGKDWDKSISAVLKGWNEDSEKSEWRIKTV